MKKLATFFTLIMMTFLAACGGGEPEAPEPMEVVFDLTTEFVFEPAQVTARAGAPITLRLNNANSAVSHSWVLVPSDIDTSATTEEIESMALSERVNSGEIAAGENTSINFTAPAPGRYKYVCLIAGHLEGGMVGDLVVAE